MMILKSGKQEDGDDLRDIVLFINKCSIVILVRVEEGATGSEQKKIPNFTMEPPLFCNIMLLQARAIYRFIKSAHNLLFDQQPTLR